MASDDEIRDRHGAPVVPPTDNQDVSMALKVFREKSREIVEAAKKDIQKSGPTLDRLKIKEIVDGWSSSTQKPDPEEERSNDTAIP